MNGLTKEEIEAFEARMTIMCEAISAELAAIMKEYNYV